MPTEAADPAAGTVVGEVPASQRLTIYTYVGFLVFLLPFTGIAGTPIKFLLKDQLHLPPDSIALFGFLVSIPAYIGFLFGVIRDRWAPFGRKDQGILALFSGVIVVLFLYLAGVKLTFLTLTVATLLRVVCGQFIGAAQRGIISGLGKEHLMSGRMSALWQAASWLPGSILYVCGGVISERLTARQTFLLAAFVSLLVFIFSLWRPKAIYGDPAETKPVSHDQLWRDAKRLAKAPGIWPITAMLFLWNFTPGVGTPIQFYLTDTLHGTATQYGVFQAIFNFFFIPTFLLHGFLCTRMPLHRILWFSTFIAVPQILPLVLVHGATSALWVGIPMGLMGGLATAAYFDLLIRACPEGLQGAAMMLGASVWALSGELGDVAGSKIYAIGGFAPCAYATVAVYACLIPVLAMVPRQLSATRDGQALAA